VLSVSKINTANIFETYESFSMQLTSYATGTGDKWPYVTLPEFETRAGKAISRTGADFIGLSSFVTEEQRSEWELYSVMNKGWINDSLEEAGIPLVEDPQIFPFIWHNYANISRSQKGPDDPYYAPLWQSAPAAENYFVTNHNVFQFGGKNVFERLYTHVSTTQSPGISEASFTPDFTSDPKTWPQSFIAVPVYESNRNTETLVGLLSAQQSWHRHFINL
jgi:hypothetical protein